MESERISCCGMLELPRFCTRISVSLRFRTSTSWSSSQVVNQLINNLNQWLIIWWRARFEPGSRSPCGSGTQRSNDQSIIEINHWSYDKQPGLHQFICQLINRQINYFIIELMINIQVLDKNLSVLSVQNLNHLIN